MGNNFVIPIGERLVERLRFLGWSQNELSRRSGVRQPSISLIVAGKRMPGALVIVALARTLAVTTDWLLGMQDVYGHPYELTMTTGTTTSTTNAPTDIPF